MLLTVPSSPPEKLTVTEVSTRYISYSWDQPPCGQRNGIIQQYSYSIAPGGEGSTTESTVTVLDLNPCTEYNFTLFAETSVGKGPAGSISKTTETDGKPIQNLWENVWLRSNQNVPEA